MDTVAADPIVDQTPVSSEEESSLSQHEATYTNGADKSPAGDTLDTDAAEEPDAAEKARDDNGRFRHRAASQRANADDVPAINALTKELRTAEAELFKLKPDAANETPRMRALKRQVAAVRAELAEHAPKPVSDLRAPEPRQQLEAPAPQTRTKPIEDEVGSKYATYADFVEDLADWKVEQREASRAQQAQEAQQSRDYSEMITGYQARMRSFADKTPDFVSTTEHLANMWLPAPMAQAIARDDKSAEFVYHLATHPDLVDDLFVATEGKPVSGPLVAYVQRRLSKALTDAQAASTGSAAVARPAYIPPRPPNPVRTGPIRTGDDLPGDESSLLDHEKAYTKPRR